MLAFDYKCLTSILNFTFWSTRAHELMEQFQTQSQHNLKNITWAPQPLSLWRWRSCLEANLLDLLVGSLAPQGASPHLVDCFLFSRDLKLVSVSAMPWSIQINQFKLAQIQQECWKRKQVHYAPLMVIVLQFLLLFHRRKMSFKLMWTVPQSHIIHICLNFMLELWNYNIPPKKGWGGTHPWCRSTSASPPSWPQSLPTVVSCLRPTWFPSATTFSC